MTFVFKSKAPLRLNDGTVIVMKQGWHIESNNVTAQMSTYIRTKILEQREARKGDHVVNIVDGKITIVGVEG